MPDSYIGRRVTFDEILGPFARFDHPGSWAKVPEGTKQYEIGLRWYVRYGAALGAITADSHQVTEHDDGTISVTPSLVMPPVGPERWHGFLTAGVFTGAFEPAPAEHITTAHTVSEIDGAIVIEPPITPEVPR